MKKIVIFASGSGTNAENIIKYFNSTNTGTVVSVFTNNSNAKVIERAKNFEIPTEIFSKEELFSGKVLQKLLAIAPDLIVLAGFLLKFPKTIVEIYPNTIINIHPALLPNYGGKGMYGMNVHRAIVENKEKETGITIHFVNENYDQGNIIFQKKVTVLVTDTPEVVAEKIHELEQKYFPKVIEDLLISNSQLLTSNF
ncbi:phosphoribosylglycinamide formyltransferase [Flavobacterium franklandianum]|uniref:Phosphoribosylglycinamide formyltransferase n=1 Tax=Flavobacterium franklandianum TaxID=2594430 RepID=A0A553CTU4_9FLAO|nr:phosphoribosylglycinamide formyltransferase [Flavobacterium franklandianum]TRX23875.1 phosphoribosylglycinamide formyltransferase [Flavobacterium franklandianum]TRX27959.1 phosphoribosylglycinamide formyltransferase [Flavobacterium franklandianum]